MTTANQLSAELSSAIVWLDLRGLDWCVFHSRADARGAYLDVAVDATPTIVSAILRDLADEGFGLSALSAFRIVQRIPPSSC